MQGTFSNKEGTFRSNSIFKKNDKCSIFEATSEMRHPTQGERNSFQVLGVNPNYAFTLERKSSDSSWTISELIDLRKDTLTPGSRYKKELNGFEDAMTVLVRLDRQDDYLAQLTRKPEFQILDRRKIAKGGENLVEADFRYPEQGGKSVREGTLVFDPQRFWCLRSYEIRI